MTYFPDIAMKLRTKVFLRQAWSREQQIAILKLEKQRPDALEILWRRLTGTGELSDFRAGQILNELIKATEEKGNE